MKIFHQTKRLIITTLVFMSMSIHGQATASQECWELVSVKSEWNKKNSNCVYEKVSPDRLKFHVSTDKSWQWVEFDEPDYYGNRLTVNLSWSPPPAHYCVNSKMGIVFKLINKTRNPNNNNVVGSLSWGPDNTKGSGRKRVTIKGSESGNTVESTAIMVRGPSGSSPNESVWYADVNFVNMYGRIKYYYGKAGSKRQETQIQQHSAPQQNKSDEGTTTVANLHAHNEAFIRSLYFAILDRRPDEGGVSNWTQWLNRGKSRAWVITQFFNSSEYKGKHKNNIEYVRDLYQGVLGRQPDSGGLANWVNHSTFGVSH